MMSRNLIGLLAITLLVSACKKNTEETVEETKNSATNFKINASTVSGPQFKTGHTDSDDKIIVTWEKGDRIGLFSWVDTDQKNTNVPLEILKTEDISNAGKNATFSGEISQNVNWNMNLYAYYPHNEAAGNNPKTVFISTEGQVIDGKQSKHLSQYDVLVADPIKNFKAAQSNTSLSFKHVMSIIDFKVSLPASSVPIEIREIKVMRQDGKRVQTNGTLNLTAENEAERLSISSTAAQSSFAQLAQVTNVTLAQGDSFNAKLAVFPTDWSAENISIYVKTSVGTYKIDKPGMKFEAGKRYRSELVLNDLLPVNIGDFYYADGTWSTNLASDKKVVGVVVYKGHKGGSSNGYVAALKDTEEATRAKGDNADQAIDVPEIPNLPRALRENTPSIYSYNEWSLEPIVYGTYIAVEDWNGKLYGEMIKRKRNETGYNKLYFLLKSVDFELEGIKDGPAAKGNWFTPAWTQLHILTDNYKFLQQRFIDAGGSFTDRQQRWSASEPLLTNTGSTDYSKYTVYSFVYTEVNTVGNWKFQFNTNLKGKYPVRPYLEF